jgi:2-polyprenyl-3-methyl-5-hydroxy-6-metoxy-1,4-benzoquinol methylase
MNFDANSLVNKDGIWYAKKNAPVSYPGHGNEVVYRIEEKSFWFSHRNECIAEVLSKFPPKGPLYDVGGGNGYVTKGLQDKGFDAVLVEPGETGCRNARQRQVKNIICSKLEDAGFEENSIPAIGVFDVVEHIEDDVAFLKTINYYLQPDGLMCITVPAYQALWSKYDEYGGHFHRYSVSSLTKKLKESGFEVLYSTYIFSILPLPIFLMRAIPSKLGLIKDATVVDDEANAHTAETTMFNKLWDWELNRIKNNKRVSFGGSCLIMARKSQAVSK